MVIASTLLVGASPAWPLAVVVVVELSPDDEVWEKRFGLQ